MTQRVAWIEVIGHGNKQAQSFRIGSEGALLGSSIHCDIWIDDIYLAAEQLRFSWSAQGQLQAEVLESRNPVRSQTPRGPVLTGLLDVSDGQQLVVGQTLLRIRTEDSRRQEALLPAPQDGLAENLTQYIEKRGTARFILLCALLTLFVEVIDLYNSNTGEFKWSDWVKTLLGLIGLVLVWSGGWSLLNRVFASAARFKAHLAVGTAALLLTSLTNEVLVYVGAGLALPGVEILDIAQRGAWLVFATLLHLLIISPRYSRWKLGGVLGLVAVFVAVFVAPRWPMLERQLGNRYSVLAVHPSRQLQEPKSLEAVLTEFDAVQSRLNQLRKEKVDTADNSSLESILEE